MKTAKIYSLPAGGETGYAWKWTCEEQGVTSKNTFALYYDCLSDAREHGYHVELTQAHGATAPAGAGYTLKGMEK